MIDEPLKSKLLKSDAFKSLSQEMIVQTQFQKTKWPVVNSCYYQDQKENKIREIDIVATTGMGLRRKYGVTRIHAVAECKSMSGFHVIANQWLDLTTEDRIVNEDPISFSWFGNQKGNREFVVKAMTDCEVPPESVLQLMADFDLWFYPNQPKEIWRLVFGTYGNWAGCSGFKETNIGSDKNLDNSVIWRASQALKSAVNSFANMKKSATNF